MLPAIIETDPAESARLAGLRYVTDSLAGIRRVRAGKSFRYVGADGKPVREKQTLERIRTLVIPPAWVEVWICPLPNGHLQATGRDAKGRKQYRYHPRYRAVRDETKYSRMPAFSEALPAVRKRVQRDLDLPGLPREKVLATVVRLLDVTYMRIGNEEYEKSNASYGLTTLKDDHVRIWGDKVRFHFRGKSGKEHEIEVHDKRLARIVKNCRDLPGYELFQYIDEKGERCTVDSAAVNDYLREISGQDFTAKDFRTWAGTVEAALAFEECGPCGSATHLKKNTAAAIKRVAGRLGNRPATCRKYYVHPAILQAYSDGLLLAAMAEWKRAGSARTGLRPEEVCVAAILAGSIMRKPARAARSLVVRQAQSARARVA